MVEVVKNFIGGEYVESTATEFVDVTNPADGSVIAQVPCSTKDEVDIAVEKAQAAFAKWSVLTVKTRVQALFALKHLMERDMDELVNSVVLEHGKCNAEAKAEVMKAIETLEWACSLPQIMPGMFLEVSRGISCREVRDPLGVVCSIVPFNFPCMVPFWTMPIAIGAGNCMILKPSEKVPLTMTKVCKLMKEAGIPDGVFQTVNGTRSTVEALVDHKDIKAVTFVGTSAVGKVLASRCDSMGKRSLCLGGAKNHLVVLPDADIEMCSSDIMNSFAGSSGQRCMAASVLVLVGEQPRFMERLVAKAQALKAGQQAGEIGPVIDTASKDRIVRYINEAEERDGAEVLVDGRKWCDRPGSWVGPTILKHKNLTDAAIKDEIFGPVLSVVQVATHEDAIKLENSNPYGNAACIYTSVGQHAEWFTKRFQAAMLGVNIGVPVPREPFSFGGMNMSNLSRGDITGQDGMEFFTQKKKITQKWVPPQDLGVMSSFIN